MNKGNPRLLSTPEAAIASTASLPARVWMILGLVLVASLVYWPSVSALYDAWTDLEGLGYTHGFLVAIACVFLLLRRGSQISEAPARVWPLGVLALLGCSLVWLVSFRASVQDAHVTVFPALLWLSVAAGFGWRPARAAAFPIGFLYFALPSWGQLAPLLQVMTVAVVRVFIGLSGIPATVSGDVVQISAGTFEVGEGCSGLHFLLVGLAVAALHGELRRDPLRIRFVHMIVLTFLALISNWVRVLTIISVGYASDMSNALVSQHYYFGWFVFAVILVIFFRLSGRYAQRAGQRRPEEEHSPVKAGSGVVRGKADALGFGAAALALMIAPMVIFGLKALAGPPPGSMAKFTAGLQSWTGPTRTDNPAWHPSFPATDLSEQVIYRDPGGTDVDVFVAAYNRQTQGAELVGYGSSVLGQAGLSPVTEQIVTSPAGSFREIVARDPSGTRSLIWMRYLIGGRPILVPWIEQFWYGLASLTREPVSAVVALRSQCSLTCEDARRRVAQLALQDPVQVITVTSGAGRNSKPARRTGA